MLEINSPLLRGFLFEVTLCLMRHKHKQLSKVAEKFAMLIVATVDERQRKRKHKQSFTPHNTKKKL